MFPHLKLSIPVLTLVSRSYPPTCTLTHQHTRTHTTLAETCKYLDGQALPRQSPQNLRALERLKETNVYGFKTSKIRAQKKRIKNQTPQTRSCETKILSAHAPRAPRVQGGVIKMALGYKLFCTSLNPDGWIRLIL